MRLVICDNQRILAEALAAALGARGHQVLAVTTTVADGVSAVSADPPTSACSSCSSAISSGGLDAARTIHQWYPDTRVLVLSEITDPETLSQAIGSGAVGFMRKDQSVDQIATALDVIAAAGGCWTRACRASGIVARRGPKPRRRWTRCRHGEGDRRPHRARRKYQADVVRDEHHGRDGPHVRKERARQSRGTQPVAAGRPCQPGRTADRPGTGRGCPRSSG